MPKKMKLRKLNKRGKILLLSLVVLVGVIIFFRSQEYEISYKIDDFLVKENYYEDEGLFTIDINYDGINYNYMLLDKYQESEIVNKITKYKAETETCLKVEFKFSDNILLCSRYDQLVHFNLISTELKEMVEGISFKEYSNNSITYKNQDVFNVDKEELYIWNYRGFDYISSENEEYNLFQQDVYNTDLIVKVNDLLVMPNYDVDYIIHQFVVFDTKSKESYIWEIDYDISYDSYIVGTNDESFFLVDRKNEIMYELVPDKEKARIYGTDYVDILVDGEWTSYNLSTVIQNNMIFSNDELYSFTLEDGKLFINFKYSLNSFLISNYEVDEIVDYSNNEVIYLVGNKLYYFTPLLGERSLVSKEEWNFNNDNKIFMMF